MVPKVWDKPFVGMSLALLGPLGQCAHSLHALECLKELLTARRAPFFLLKKEPVVLSEVAHVRSEDWNSRTQEPAQNPEDSQTHKPDCVTFSPPLLSLDAARLPTWCSTSCFFVATNIPLSNRDPRLACTWDRVSPSQSGQRTADHTQQSHEPCSTQRTSQHAAMGNTCQQKALQHRWTDCLLPTKSSNDASSLARHISASRTRRQGHQPLGSSTSAGGGEDENTDIGTDTTPPDDDNHDIAAFTSQQTTVIHTPNL